LHGVLDGAIFLESEALFTTCMMIIKSYSFIILSLSLTHTHTHTQDGFHEVVETLLNKQRRKQREQERARTQPDNTDSFWQSTATVGAVAVGAAVLLGLRQAFS
jgi:anti-sigma-K factor RskA